MIKAIVKFVMRILFYQLILVVLFMTALHYEEFTVRILVSPTWGGRVFIVGDICYISRKLVLSDDIAEWCVANQADTYLLGTSY